MTRYDPEKDFTVTSQTMHFDCDHTIWEGVTFCGYPVKTYLRERLIYDNGTFTGKPSVEKYVKIETRVKKKPAGEKHIGRN